MYEPELSQFRIAVIGLEGRGKSALIQRLCTNVFAETPHTETEQQSTAVWDQTFVFFWEFPAASLDASNVDSLVVGFGGILFVFDLLHLEGEEWERSRSYLATLMSHPFLANTPYLLIGTKADLVEELQEIHPPLVMNALTENLRKTQLIFCSSKTEMGLTEIMGWIKARANTSSVSESHISS
jgi:GTPase SAR1 family protein